MELIAVRNKKEIGIKGCYGSFRYTVTGPSGVLDPQPPPTIKEQLLQFPDFCLLGHEQDLEIDRRRTLEAGTPPSPEETLARIRARTQREDVMPVGEGELGRIAQGYYRPEAQELEEVEALMTTRTNGLPPSPEESMARVKRLEAARAAMATRMVATQGGVPQPVLEQPVQVDEVGEVVGDEARAMADSIASIMQTANLVSAAAEDIQKSEEPEVDYGSMDLHRLRAAARDKKVPGWAEMSQAKLVKALRARG